MNLLEKQPPLLASDLDGTLIPPRASEEHRGAIAAFRELVRATDLPITYVTGRHLALAERGIEEFGLPRPGAIACDVGTSLYWCRDGAFHQDLEYRETVASTPGVASARNIQAALADQPGFTLQESEKQGDFKVSFYFDPETPANVIADIEHRLGSGTSARLVWSRDAATGVGLLDVLPAAVGKETAVAFTADRLGWTRDDVIFAGDSGNDRDAFLAGWRAIVVGNTPDRLKAEVRADAVRSGIADAVYFSSSDIAAGVVEGLHHFRVW